MAPEKDTPEWYLEGSREEGRKGPFSIKDIQELRNSGRLSDTQRVSSPYLGSQTVTVAELLGLSQPKGTHKSFSPPPRPEIERTGLIAASASSKINSAITLFETLQAAKERRPKTTAESAEDVMHVRPSRAVTPSKGIALALLALVLVAGAAWVVWEKKSIKPQVALRQKSEDSHAGGLSSKPGVAPQSNPGKLDERPSVEHRAMAPIAAKPRLMPAAPMHPNPAKQEPRREYEEANQPPTNALDNPRDDEVTNENAVMAPLQNNDTPPEDSQGQGQGINSAPPQPANPSNQDPQPPQFE